MDLRPDNPCDRIGPVLGAQGDVARHMRALPHGEVASAVETVGGGGSPPVVHQRVVESRSTISGHGDSCGRDWVAEETDPPRDVIEAALAHVVRNKVEAACRRTDLFERRRRLMDDWAGYLAGERDPEARAIR